MDRIPAWTRVATAPEGVLGASYSGVHWQPEKPHVWVNPRPAPPASLRIYEAHVGMSSEECHVASYTFFRGL